MSEPLCKLRIESLTPVSLGGYDTYMSRHVNGLSIKEPMRLPSLKGVWRWWMRRYVAGAAWDSHKDELMAAEYIVNNLLGSTEKASIFGLKSYGERLETISPTEVEDLRGVARIRLLLLGKKRWAEEEHIKRWFGKLSATIEVYARARVNEHECKLAIGSLITAIRLGGLGKGSRRGFGSFKVEVMDPHACVKELANLNNALNRANDLSSVKEILHKLIEVVRKSSFQVLTKFDSSASSKYNLPRIGCISPNSLRLYIMRPREPVSLMRVLWLINQSVMRTERHSITASLIGREAEPRKAVQHPLALFMGLPRTQRGKGYLLRDERRASPLIYSLLSDALGRPIVSALLFMSLDWPAKVEWVGRRKISIRISEGTVKWNNKQENLKDLFSDMVSYLGRYFSQMKRWELMEVL